MREALKHMRWFLWSPAMVMLGIGMYFSPSNEPPVMAGPAAFGLIALTIMLTPSFTWRMRLVPLLLISVGFLAAQYRAQIVATNLLAQEIHNREVEGTIDEIEPVEEKEKLVLSHLVIGGVAPDATPLRVRVSFRRPDERIKVGDRVRFTANLFPLPAPIMPGSYDFARHFYFRSIGGNGFAMRGLDIVDAGDHSGWRTWVNNLRHTIGAKMRAGMSGPVGTVAAAMTVGETGPIPSDIKASLRDSGLAHMLAIAGLHLGIVTGIVFYNVRLLLTLMPRLALRIPVKKIAALCALVSAFIYLMLAGAPIPAQRAFIMVVFLFTGIMLDRKAVTLRTLTLAALIILLLFPESMFGPSFQMSFAATLAIVSLYERYGRRLMGQGGPMANAWMHLLGIIATSLVATLSTAPFVLYHFNRFAIFGLLSNMIVVPLATFIIMPGMVLALLLMPLGLEFIGYAPMQFGTGLMIRMSQWVVSLPYASVHLPAPSDVGLMICTFGLMWLCLNVGRIRLAGLAIIALGLATISQHVPVDALVSADAHQMMVRLDSGHYAALKGTARSFNMQNWLRAEGEDDLVPLADSGIACDASLCISHARGHTVIMVKKPDDSAALLRACAMPSDVLVAWYYLANLQCPNAAIRIGRDELERYGAHAVWFTDKGIRVARTRENADRRIWQLPFKNDEEGEED